MVASFYCIGLEKRTRIAESQGSAFNQRKKNHDWNKFLFASSFQALPKFTQVNLSKSRKNLVDTL